MQMLFKYLKNQIYLIIYLILIKLNPNHHITYIILVVEF
jgi:hypothetical protein